MTERGQSVAKCGPITCLLINRRLPPIDSPDTPTPCVYGRARECDDHLTPVGHVSALY